MSETRAGDAGPKSYVLDLTNDDSNGQDALDFNTVTAAEFHVRHPDPEKTTRVWTATISNQSTNTIRLTHVYAADGSDLPIGGSYSVYARLTVPDGAVKSVPVVLPVRDEFAFE